MSIYFSINPMKSALGRSQEKSYGQAFLIRELRKRKPLKLNFEPLKTISPLLPKRIVK